MDQTMNKMQSSQSGFAYNANGLLVQKKKKKRQNLKETWDLNYIYQNELNKAYFQNGIAHGNYKSVAYKTVSNKAFRVKAFLIADHLEHDGYQNRLVSMVNKFFD